MSSMASNMQRQHQPTSPMNTQNPYYISSPLASGGAVSNSRNSSSYQNTNPFRRHASSPSTSSAFSPISPIDEEGILSIVPPPASHTRMSQERRSTDLRRLDGKPYPGTEIEKSRKVKVAQDMYAGDQPPGYDSHGYKDVPAEKSEKGHRHSESCGKCGGHKKAPSAIATTPAPQPQNIDCNQCGGKRSTPPSSYPGATVRTQPTYQPIQSSEAGPSNARNQRHSCGKCGRRKKNESPPVSGSSSPRQFVPGHRSVPSIQTNGIPVDINIEPPTALNERAPTFPQTSPVGAPLSKEKGRSESPPKQPERKPSRGSSVSRLFRSLSRRKSSQDSVPTQESSSRRSTSYTRLDGREDVLDRPPSPFSFVDKPREDQAFELGDMRRSKMPERRDSWDKADETTNFLTAPVPRRPRMGRSQSTTDAVLPEDKKVDDIYLSLPPDQRPGITRFKSLRSGVTRAADGLSRSASQISRSSSMKRLGSVKKVPSLWYRDDMAIEGATGDYDHYGY